MNSRSSTSLRKDIDDLRRELLRQRARRMSSGRRDIDIVEWTESNRILKGRPFSFRDRDYLLPIYCDKSPRIIIVKARQMEMTECIVNWLLFKLLMNPDTVGLYTAPRQDQVRRFSRDRIRKAIKESSVLRGVLEAARSEEGKGAITRIPFGNGSLLYMHSGWGEFDALRGIPADFAALDEFQDMQSEALPVLTEGMSHSDFSEMLIVGTASDQGSEFDKIWNLSDMNEWDAETKAWVPHAPQNRSYRGYHITQRMAPWIMHLPPEHINSVEYKRMHYSERRFLNEVLGLFYRGLAKPLLPEDLLNCVDRKYGLVPRLDPPYVSFMGIDWGGGEFAFTVVWIMGMDDKDCWRILYVHKFDEKDPLKQVDMIANMIDHYNVTQAVADVGYGAVQVNELQKRFASRVYGCNYVRRPDKPLRLEKEDEFGRSIAHMMVNADRSFWIEQAIDTIKRRDPAGHPTPRLVIPYMNPADIEWIFDHFTCIEREEQQTMTGKKFFNYTHPVGQADDALHGYVYALIAYATTTTRGDFAIHDLFG